MCQEDGRTREIIGILENLAENSRTIIFASKKQDVVNLHNVCTVFILFSSLAPIKRHLGLRSVAKPMHKHLRRFWCFTPGQEVMFFHAQLS